MGLRFDPIGGGQFKQAVKQIIEAESQPIKAMGARKVREEERLKLFQEFKGKFQGAEKTLEEISTFQKLHELKIDLGDGANYISMTIDKERAQPGSYTLQIDELAQRTSVISNGFEDPDQPVMGLGFIVMYLPDGDTKEIFVDDSKSSLRGVASLINNDPTSPVKAVVLRDATEPDNPWKLVISGKNSGSENQIDFPDFYFLDGQRDFSIEDSHEAQNALIRLDGFEIEVPSNDIPDFLPGVNLHLKQARPDQAFNIIISEDYQKVTGKMKAFVDQLNQVLHFITKQNAVDEKSDTRTMFTGDTGLQTIEYRIRNLMHEGFPFGDPDADDFRLVFMNEMGIEFNKSGQLAFKEDKFTKFIEKDFDAAIEAITGGFGFAFQFKELLSAYTQVSTGTLAIREQGLRSRIKEIDRQIETKAKLLERRHQNLTDQFARLEATLSNLQRQHQYLTAAMPAAGGGNNMVAQLLGG